MLRVDQVHVIRHKVLVEGLSRRRVAAEMGVSRNTVRKYLEHSEPVRCSSGARQRPVYERVVGRLESLKEEWTSRTTAKQRVTAPRLHRELRSEGYEVSLTVVQDWLRKVRRQAAEVYVPLVHHPGDSAQVDFFDVTVEVGGVRRKAWMFVMRLMYSGRDFVWLYEWAATCIVDIRVSGTSVRTPMSKRSSQLNRPVGGVAQGIWVKVRSSLLGHPTRSIFRAELPHQSL